MASLQRLRRRLQKEGDISDGAEWQAAVAALGDLQGELTTLLKETLALRGIRFDELEAIDRYTFEIPSCCRLILEIDRAAHAITEELLRRARSGEQMAGASIAELTASHAVFARRISELLAELIESLQDLAAFVPLWMKNLRLRRALFLHGLDEAALTRRGAPIAGGGN